MVILLFSSSFLYAEENICYKPEVASKIVVDLQKANITNQELIATQKLNDELKVQIESLNQIIVLQKEQINILDSGMSSYKDLLKIQKEGYEKEIKNAKPKLLDTILKSIGLVGAGIVIGALLI